MLSSQLAMFQFLQNVSEEDSPHFLMKKVEPGEADELSSVSQLLE